MRESKILPARVIAEFAKDYQGGSGSLLQTHARDIHWGINHTFQSWRDAMMSTAAIPIYENFDESRERKLFDEFCDRLAENGVPLTKDQKEAAFKEYIED